MNINANTIIIIALIIIAFWFYRKQVEGMTTFLTPNPIVEPPQFYLKKNGEIPLQKKYNNQSPNSKKWTIDNNICQEPRMMLRNNTFKCKGLRCHNHGKLTYASPAGVISELTKRHDQSTTSAYQMPSDSDDFLIPPGPHYMSQSTCTGIHQTNPSCALEKSKATTGCGC